MIRIFISRDELRVEQQQVSDEEDNETEDNNIGMIEDESVDSGNHQSRNDSSNDFFDSDNDIFENVDFLHRYFDEEQRYFLILN